MTLLDILRAMPYTYAMVYRMTDTKHDWNYLVWVDEE